MFKLVHLLTFVSWFILIKFSVQNCNVHCARPTYNCRKFCYTAVRYFSIYIITTFKWAMLGRVLKFIVSALIQGTHQNRILLLPSPSNPLAFMLHNPSLSLVLRHPSLKGLDRLWKVHIVESPLNVYTHLAGHFNV